MARGIAATVALVALVAVLVVRAVSYLSDSPVLIGLAIVAVISAAAAVGVAVASRASAAYNILVRRDQAIAVAASHELRTPITALRLSLEDMTLWPTTPPEISEELHRAIGELDRLSDAVTRLLDQHRVDHLVDAEVDVRDLTSDAVGRWSATTSSSRPVHIEAPAAAPVRLEPGAITRVIAAQLGQFDARGAGDVTVQVTTLRSTVRVRVLDQSAPRFPTGVIHGPVTGKGPGEALTLEEAGGVAESLGGFLAVEDLPTTCISLILPAADARTAV